MTDEDLLATARRFVAKWQPRLHLDEWRIGIGLYAQAQKTEEAAVSYHWREHRAYLQVRPSLVQWKRERTYGGAYQDESDDQPVEAAVLHELVHLTQLPLGTTFDCAFTEWVGSDGAMTSDLRTHWTDYVELVTERTTRLLLDADRSGGWAGD